MGANAQVALEFVQYTFTADCRKFARYFDVEGRILPVCKESSYCLDLKKIRENLDENTIGKFHT